MEVEMSLTIRELPAAERPRERLRSHGAHALSSSELLAILLGSGYQGRSAIGIGQEILSTCRGSLRLLATQPVASLTSVRLSLIHISEPTRLGMISYAVFCLK